MTVTKLCVDNNYFKLKPGESKPVGLEEAWLKREERIIGPHILRKGIVKYDKVTPDACFKTLLAVLSNEVNPELIGAIAQALE